MGLASLAGLAAVRLMGFDGYWPEADAAMGSEAKMGPPTHPRTVR